MQDQLLTALLSAYEGKLDVADPDLLQKASLLAQLSDAAYGSFASFAAPVIAKKQTFAAVPGQMQNFKPVFDTHLSKLNSTYTESGQQYGIWEVAGLGVVVAFQGCRTPLDKLAQLSCKPCSLDNQSQIQLHEGICQAVTPCCKELAQACVKLCSSSTAAEQESLFNTGVSTPFYNSWCFWDFVQNSSICCNSGHSLAGAPQCVHL